MKISELDENQIKTGIRLKSKNGALAIVVYANHQDRELWCEILFENNIRPTGMFITWMDKFDFEIIDDTIISDEIQSMINSYPKCKCKDCSK